MAAQRIVESWIILCCFVCIIGSSLGTPTREREIEARRRLDQNFMRLGRSPPSNTHMMVDGGDEGSKTNKQTRSPVKNVNFMRFGRAGNSFMRLGRSDGRFNAEPQDQNELQAGPMELLLIRPQTRASNSFLRFGRPSPGLIPAEAIWPLWQQQQQQLEQLSGQPEEFPEEVE